MKIMLKFTSNNNLIILQLKQITFVLLIFSLLKINICDNISENNNNSDRNSYDGNNNEQKIIEKISSNQNEENQLIRENLLITQQIINSNINPCDDFIKYACDNYNQNLSTNIEIDPDIVDEKYMKFAFESVTDQTDDDVGYLSFESAIKAKNFYKSCLQKNNFKSMLRKIDILKDLNDDWPILAMNNENSISGTSNNSGSSSGNDNKNVAAWMKISEELKLVDIDPLLEISYDDFNMIEIYNGYRVNDITQKGYIKNELIELNKTLLEFNVPTDKLENFINDFIRFIENLHRIFSASNNPENCDNVNNNNNNNNDDDVLKCDKEDNHKNLFLYYDMGSFKDEFPNIDWNLYFKIVFKKDIDDNEPIKIKRQKFTKPLLKLIEKTDNKILTNYCIWLLIRRLQKIDSEEENCNRKTFKYFDSVLTGIYSRLLFNENDRNHYLEILNRFEQSFESISKQRYNVTQQKNLLYILIKEKRYINKLNKIFSFDKLNNDYKNVEINENNYLQNLINLLGKQNKCNFIERECMERFDLMLFIHNVITLHNKSKLYSFSTKYYSLWESIIQNCYTRRRLNSTQYNDAKLCAKKQYENLFIHNDDDHAIENNLSSNYNSEMSHTIITTAALQQTFEDYDKWLQDNEQYSLASNNIFKDFGLNNRKVFFINFVQQYCNQGNLFKQIIKQSLMNLELFSEIYNCPIDSKMNVKNKCKIW